MEGEWTGPEGQDATKPIQHRVPEGEAMSDHCFFIADRQAIRCDHCGVEISFPLPMSVDTLVVASEAFSRVHQSCVPVGNATCSAGDHDDACKALPRTLVETMARCASILFDEGDAFQAGGELADFVRAVAEVARKETP